MWDWWMAYSPLHYGENYGELLKYFKYYQVISTRTCYPNMHLSSEEASFCRREIGERVEGDDRKGKENKRGCLTLAHFFQKFMIYWNTQWEPRDGESEYAKNPRLKRCTLCSGKIPYQPREGFMELMELMNCRVESALVFALCCVI